MNDKIVIVEVAMNLIAFYGVGYYLVYLLRNRSRSPLENSLLTLLWTVALLLLIRSTSWYFGGSTILYKFEMAPAILIPLSVLLLTEGLLRRHAPLFAKIFISAVTVFFMVWNWTSGLSITGLSAFAGFLATSIAMNAYLLINRDRASLSSSENNLINAFIVAAMFCVPLVITDFREELTIAPIRMGSIGALLLVYVFIRGTQRDTRKRAVFFTISRFVGRGAILGFAQWVIIADIAEMRGHEIGLAIALASSLVLLFMVIDHVEQLGEERQRYSLSHWIGRESIASLNEFASALQKLPQLGNIRLLHEDRLKRYDEHVVTPFLKEQVIVSLAKARKQWQPGHPPRDQILDLLESQSATHLCMISEKPWILIVCTLPEVGQGASHEAELRVIQKLGMLIVKGEGV
jgi:hypothetical protein